MLTSRDRFPISTMLIPPWISPTMYSCYRSEPLKGSRKAGFDGPIYGKLYCPKEEIMTDRHIYTSTSNSFCTKGFPMYDRYKESYHNQFPRIAEDLKTFDSIPLKSCCN